MRKLYRLSFFLTYFVDVGVKGKGILGIGKAVSFRPPYPDIYRP